MGLVGWFKSFLSRLRNDLHQFEAFPTLAMLFAKLTEPRSGIVFYACLPRPAEHADNGYTLDSVASTGDA
ncbi:MAG: hypothetical protein NTX52_06420 [Planctomycetota bacterium]|nr:hypothetical protein [Planctomycetota bacterium]